MSAFLHVSASSEQISSHAVNQAVFALYQKLGYKTVWITVMSVTCALQFKEVCFASLGIYGNIFNQLPNN